MVGRKHGIDTDEYDRETSDAMDEFVKSELDKDWSYEELQRKYNRLKEVVLKNFPTLWFTLEFALSVKTIMNVKGINLPFIGILLGPPSSMKTFVVELFRKYDKFTLYTDEFSPRALVSHNSGLKEKDLRKIDLLPRIRNKLFLTPELSPMFSAKDDDLLSIIGRLTRVSDGSGYANDSGAQGHRGYAGEMMFCWLGAAVNIPYKVHKLMSFLGPKLYFSRLPWVEVSEEEYFRTRNDDFHSKKQEIETALLEYLYYFEMNPAIILEEETESERVIWNGHSDDSTEEDYENNRLPKIKTCPEFDDDKTHKIIIKLCTMLAHLRAFVPTFQTYGTQGADYAYALPTIEDPSRAIQQMRNLAKGHALSQGRLSITLDDIPIVMHTVFSSTTLERVKLLGLLIKENGTLTTGIVCENLGVSRPTARRTMTELKASGLVDYTTSPEEEERNDIEMGIVLKQEFNWFLSAEFKEVNAKLLKEKYPPPTYVKKENVGTNEDNV
jgi:DNA-binding transcriptional ArsR family regulator